LTQSLALATRGLQDADFAEVADISASALEPGFDEAVAGTLCTWVSAVAARSPLDHDLDQTDGVR
jgi:glycine hydroxymethyltransferase